MPDPSQVPNFREIPKVPVNALVPREVDELIHDLTHLNRESRTAVVTALILKGAGLSPADVGLAHVKTRIKPPRPAVAVGA